MTTKARLALSFDGVSIVYRGNKSSTVAVETLSLDIPHGAFFVIVGPSGCGKSTLLSATTGSLPEVAQVSGNIRSSATSLGYLLQRDTLLPWRTALANVTVPLEIKGTPKVDQRDLAIAALRRFGISEYAHRFPRELSGGMRQRVLLARTVVYQPDLILLDEPLGSLDALSRQSLQEELLATWRSSGATFVLVTHDLEEAVSLGTHIAVFSSRPARLVRIYSLNHREERVETRRFDERLLDVRRSIWNDLASEKD